MKTKWYDNKIIVFALLIFFLPAGLFGLWKSSKFERPGKIAWSVVGVLVLLAWGHNQQPAVEPWAAKQNGLAAAHPSPTESSQKISDLAKKATVSKDRKENTKITYEVLISEKDICSISEKEAGELLATILAKDEDHGCCERAFIRLSPFGVGALFLSGQEENGKFEISTTGWPWESLTCGLKISSESRGEVKQKLRWLRNETGILANEFIVAYESGQNLGKFSAKSSKIKDQWNKFLNKKFGEGENDCRPILYYPEIGVETSATSLLSTIEFSGNNPSFSFEKNSFARDYQKMNALQI